MGRDLFADIPPEDGGQTVGRDLFADGPQDGFLDNALDVAGEFSAGANRAVAGTVDLPIDAVNAALRLGDVNYQLPTVTGALESTGIQGGFMEPGAARDVVSAAGTTLPAAAALHQVPRNLATTGGAAAEWLGLGSAKSPAILGQQVDPSMLPVVRDAPQVPSESVQRELALKRRTGDVVAAGHRLSEVGDVIPSATQGKAIKAGMPERIVAQFHSASPADKKRLSSVLDEVERGLKNKTYGDYNPPRMVLGDSMVDRYSVIADANKQAGQAVRHASESLRGQPIDLNELYQGPMKSFLGELEGFDVAISPNGIPDFSQSVFKKSSGSQKVISDVLDAMRGIRDPDNAYEVHKAKKVIDDMVSEYGSTKEGLSGNAENLIKGLRHDFNGFLRDRYPDYASANDVFSETKDILDDTQRLIGRRNTADSANLGKAARKALSNYQTGEQMKGLMDSMDEMARKYGLELDDDLRLQTSAVQSIEEMFPSSRAPASLVGQLDKAAATAVDAARGSTGVVDMAVSAAKDYFSNGEVAAGMKKIESLRGLLAE